jgi:hypothetical protein
MEKLVEDITSRLKEELPDKVSFDIRGNDDEHWIRIEKEGYKACIHLEELYNNEDGSDGEGEDVSKIALLFYDNARPAFNVDYDYTNGELEEAIELYISRINRYVD